MALTHVKDTDFESEVLHSESPVLVDFFADWCGPCKMLSPVIEEIAAEHTDLKVVKLNVDEAPETAAKYSVISIPTVILFKDGEPVHQTVGFRPKASIEKEMEL